MLGFILLSYSTPSNLLNLSHCSPTVRSLFNLFNNEIGKITSLSKQKRGKLLDEYENFKFQE